MHGIATEADLIEYLAQRKRDINSRGGQLRAALIGRLSSRGMGQSSAGSIEGARQMDELICESLATEFGTAARWSSPQLSMIRVRELFAAFARELIDDFATPASIYRLHPPPQSRADELRSKWESRVRVFELGVDGSRVPSEPAVYNVINAQSIIGGIQQGVSHSHQSNVVTLTILLLGHPNKGGDTYSGSTAWLNAVRSQVTMTRPEDAAHDPDLRAIHCGKPNYAPAGEALRCRWSEWAFIRDEDLPDDKREQLSEAIAASGANLAFLECLRARSSQGDARAVGPKPGPSYAPTQFESMPQAKGYDRQALKQAMERLFNLGRIESITCRNAQKGRDVTVIREVPEPSPNSFPNPSRTLFPDSPELTPNSPRTVPEHTTPPTGECVGTPEGGPHTSSRHEGATP